MLVVDGCFILELLYRYFLLKPPKENPNEESKATNPKEKTNEENKEMPIEEISDPVFGSNLMSITVLHDLLLLENRASQKLFHITVDKIPGRPPNYLLFHYVFSYFSNMTMSLEGKSTTRNTTNCFLPSECVLSLVGNRMNSKNEDIAKQKKSKEVYYHILHIIHDNCHPLDPPKAKAYRELMPFASDLDYAGVKFVPALNAQSLFKVQFTDAQSCLKTCFHRARFEIQTLSLYNSTKLFLRNLVAFEQCCPGISCYFTSYAFLMGMLVNSAKDVEVLQKAGIIQNYLGADQDTSDLFNKLCKEVVEKFFFTETCKQGIMYSKRCWPATVAHVKRKYFATPWTFIAFCMSITQFVRSFLLEKFWFGKYEIPKNNFIHLQ